MNYKDQFYEFTKKYFDSGIFKEIYSSEYISICNVSNEGYLTFIYDSTDYNKDELVGFSTPSANIPKIIEDNSWVYRSIMSLSEEEWKSITCRIDDEMFKKLLSLKEKHDAIGPSKYVDLELEEELRQKSK